MHVTANKDTCAVSSLCVYRAPEVFDQDDEGQVVVLRSNPPEELHDAVRDAARSCPTQSILIDEEIG